METHELIAALAADETPPEKPRLALRVIFGAGIAFAVMLIALGLRPDLGSAMRDVPVLAKTLLPVLFLSVVGVMLFATPMGAKPSLRIIQLCAAIIGLVWLGFALSGGDVMGQTALACLLSVPLLALPIGGALILGLRRRVEPHGAARGLLAGLFAGALATAIYALHCDEDAPAFFLLWYSLGIAISGAAGRIAGRRLLNV